MRTEAEVRKCLRELKRDTRDANGEPTDEGHEGSILALEWVLEKAGSTSGSL
jgi:hypothetical protein